LKKQNGGEMAEKELSPTVKLFGSEVSFQYGKTFGDAVWKEVYRRTDRLGTVPESSVVSIYEEFGSKKPEFKLFVLGFMGGTLGDMQ
jgi:hypothetical protein